MRKPNDGYTPEEIAAMTAEYERLMAVIALPDDIIAGAVELRQVTGMLAPMYAALGLDQPAIDYGHPYWLAQDPEVYQRIDEIAGRPLSEAAIRLKEKYGLG